MEKPIFVLEDESELKLIVKSKNSPGHPLYREDLPPILWGQAPRIVLGSAWFNKYTNNYKSAGCQACLRPGATERHELYGLYQWKTYYVIRLEGILNLCKSCHLRVHQGFAEKRLSKYGPTLPSPYSDALDPKKYPWEKASLLLIDKEFYPL